jgi:LysR family cyn operon transcriptional activator
MRFNLAQLEALLWAIRLGSFHGAATHLSLTQPAISARIKELESAVGGKLFLRDSYRATPTVLGREVAAHAELVLSACEALDGRLTSGDELRGPVRIGVADSFAMSCLPDLMHEIDNRFASLRPEIQVNFSAELNKSLQVGNLDIAVLTDVTHTPLITVEPLAALELSWVASPKLSLNKNPFYPADLAALPILTNPDRSQLFTSIAGWFAAAGVQPSRINACNSLMIMMRLACEGVGISLLPTSILQTELEFGRLVVLKTAPKMQPVAIDVAYRRAARCGALGPLARTIHALAEKNGYTSAVSRA